MTRGPEQALPSCPTCSIPSVIPDMFNRESMAFPMQGDTNKRTEEKAPGFPLKTGGNDRGGAGGYDKVARRT